MKRKQKEILLASLFPISFLGGLCSPAYGDTLDSMNIEELLRQRTEIHSENLTASAVQETVRDAPAAMIVITQKDIERRGYDSMDDVLMDLPGFDTTVTNGTEQVVSYQRGYRTPWTQRTLFLINGKVENNLWMHAASFSRQYPMSHIDRIEVLYGPSGAVYGPNAFLGVVNIITKSAKNNTPDKNHMDVALQAGSYNTQALEVSSTANYQAFGLSFAGRLFESDEAPIEDYSDWGYTQESQLAQPDVWGAGIGAGFDPVDNQTYSPAGDLNVNGVVDDHEKVNGRALGAYADPSRNWSVMLEGNWQGWSLGLINWNTHEGYGPYYSFLDGQPNANWIHDSRHYYLEHQNDNTQKIQVHSKLVYREHEVGGDWAESFGNFVSLSNWLSSSDAWRIEQNYQYQLNDSLALAGGLKYEEKRLARGYVICNYWDGVGFCPQQAAGSSNGLSSDGSGVIEADLVSSVMPQTQSPVPSSNMPSFNILDTRDTGAFAQATYGVGKWRLNGALRWDKNSEYGAEINPRTAVVYHFSPITTFKLVYGEAFQEPSPKDLYGSWNGRDANPSLEPEHVRNLEFIMNYQGHYWLHDMSLYQSQYKNVITSSANVGEREITGFEYRGKYRFPNPFNTLRDVTGNFFYTYTRAMASHQYDTANDAWIENQDHQGDIAPHKIHFLVNWPLSTKWNLNLRTSWVDERTLFSLNPLRAEYNSLRTNDRKAPAYTKFDASILYAHQDIKVSFKVDNILEETYYHPGVESAGSGDNFNIDADGFQNSLIPQVAERTFSLNVKVKFQ